MIEEVLSVRFSLFGIMWMMFFFRLLLVMCVMLWICLVCLCSRVSMGLM